MAYCSVWRLYRNPPMSLLGTLKFIATHPLNRTNRSRGLWPWLRWQLGSRLAPGPVVYPWIEGTKLLVHRGEASLTANIYTGLFEFADMAFLLHLLRPSDVFADVGANLGAYTILASGASGATTYAIEPIPHTYSRLVENVAINNLHDRVHCLNNGLGAERSTLMFTTSREGSMNRVVTDADRRERAIEVDVLTLDDVATEPPIAIKIDVEGYEHAVLKGAPNTLRNPTLRALILEMYSGANRYGFDESDIVHDLAKLGFQPFAYEPFTRKLTAITTPDPQAGNTMFIRDLPFVTERIQCAHAVTVHGHNL